MAWLETLLNGVMLGGLYGLFGIGLAFAFGIMRIVNVAHGEFIVLAAYIGLSLLIVLPIHPLWLIVPVALISFGLGVLLQIGLLNRVIGRASTAQASDPIPPMLVTFGLSIVIRNGLVELYGADVRAIQMGDLQLAGWQFWGLNVGVFPLLVFAIAVALFAALHGLMKYTAFGRILRATADDREVVQLVGVRQQGVYGVAMGLALALSSVAGLLLAMRSSISPFSGIERLLIAFEVVIIGGVGSLWGTLIGGLVLGVAQLVGLKLNPNSGPLLAHGVFFLILLLAPQGLAGWWKARR